MEIIKYRNWVLAVDRPGNEALYNEVEVNGAQSCGCDDWQYFDSIGDALFPDEVKQLFLQLGIDIKKNFDVSDFGGGAMGHTFNGQFHFKGALLEGGDCYGAAEGGGYQVNLLPVSDHFKIGFTQIVTDSFFNEGKEIVKIEFMAKVP